MQVFRRLQLVKGQISSWNGFKLKSNFRNLNFHKMAALHTNRLINEKSPYLLQHAHNPVDWYPWCEEAIKRARDENKIIFLSVGYSTCHWCHVMEHESFENEATAKLMNDKFINIKVDREERPDIDKLYMTFILLINGSGGWPMSVFLTPDLTPFTGGTYFPPADRWGMPGFPTILNKIHKMWQEKGEEIKTTGQNIIKAIEKHALVGGECSADERQTVEQKFNQGVQIFKRNYDDVWGGSSSAPKFLEIAKLNFKFHAFAQTGDKEILDVALLQLDKMANGGIHDHIFGGFARYSVDKKWHVPHFEKMLYDQGQIMGAYANAYKITRNEKYLKIADKIHSYVVKDLRNDRGGFYSGEDADSLPKVDSKEKVEGAFYAWTEGEIKEILLKNQEKFNEFKELKEKVAEIFLHHYEVQSGGNVEPHSDPHGHLLGKNILIVFGSLEETAEKFGTSPEIVEKILEIAHECLHEVRSKRPRPHLDTKVICAWNGLLLSGLSKLSTIKNAPNQSKYLETARTLVDFIKSDLYDKNSMKLRRSTYGNEVPTQSIYGFLDDYAFLIRGLIDYYAATLDVSALKFARQLQDKQNELFWDEEGGGYFYSEAGAENVIVRLKEDHDGAEPCGNSVAVQNLCLLKAYFDDDESYGEKLERIYKFFDNVKPFAYALPEMMSGFLIKDAGPAMLVTVGPQDSPDVTKLLETGRNFHVPGLLVFHSDPSKPELALKSSIKDFKMVDNKATAYFCERNVCNTPAIDVETLEKQLESHLLK